MNSVDASERPGRLGATAVLAGCGGAGGRSILLYNGQHPQVTSELVAAFEKQTGIEVRVHTNDGIVLADQLLQEGSSSPADVYLTENSPELVTIDEHGLLAKLDRSTLAQVPARYEASSGNWVGIARRISALAYDPARVSAAHCRSRCSNSPTRMEGQGRDRADGLGLPAARRRDHRRLRKAGRGQLARGAQAQRPDLPGRRVGRRGRQPRRRGDGRHQPLLLVPPAARARRAQMHSALYFFPNHDVGSIENISGAGVLASSNHPREAQAFVSFLLSPTAQQILAHGYDFEYPTRPGVGPNPQLSPLSAIEPATLGANALGNDQQAAQLIEEAGLA